MSNYENSNRVISLEALEYDASKYSKNDISPFFYLTKKGFKELSEETEDSIDVIGDIFINRKTQKDTTKNGEVIGTVKIPYSYAYLRSHYDASDKEYPLYKSKKKWRRTIGYAELENHKFVRLVKGDIRFVFIILLLLLALIPLFFHSCSNVDPVSIITGDEITEAQEKSEPSPMCYYEPFQEITTLTKENPEISLVNVATNDKTYYVSYEIFINGVQMKDENGKAFSTGAIPPNRQVNINLWNQLDAGNYQLEVKATDYDYSILTELNENKDKYSEKEYQSLLNEATMPVYHTLSTTLIISK